jgi:hypothetical protein
MRPRAALLFLASFAIPTLGHADIVKPGSSFNVVLEEADGATVLANTSVMLTAGGTTSFTFNGVSTTASESETTLSSGQNEIIVSINASGDLFPEIAAGQTYSGFVGVGDRTPIQLTTPFDLTSALLTYSSPSGPYASGDTIGNVSNRDPFNGAYAGNFLITGYIGVGGFDTTSITLDLIGTPIAATPEPSSFALLGTGLFGVAGLLRKRFA